MASFRHEGSKGTTSSPKRYYPVACAGRSLSVGSCSLEAGSSCPVQTRKRRPREPGCHHGVTAEPQRDRAVWTPEPRKRNLSQCPELLGGGGLCRNLVHKG